MLFLNVLKFLKYVLEKKMYTCGFLIQFCFVMEPWLQLMQRMLVNAFVGLDLNNAVYHDHVLSYITVLTKHRNLAIICYNCYQPKSKLKVFIQTNCSQRLQQLTTVCLNDALNAFVFYDVIFLSLLSCKKSLFPRPHMYLASLLAWKTKASKALQIEDRWNKTPSIQKCILYKLSDFLCHIARTTSFIVVVFWIKQIKTLVAEVPVNVWNYGSFNFFIILPSLSQVY